MYSLLDYLEPTHYIDSNNPDIKSYALNVLGNQYDTTAKAQALYYAVRDDIYYNPNYIVLRPDYITAGLTLKRGMGYCVEKSLLLAACGRSVGIPSRLGFSIVRNHLSTPKFTEMLKTDKFVFHGYNEFYIRDKWVKCTPAFNKSLCEKFGTQPLDWDGESDSIFQPYSADGRQYMEYLHDYGHFIDFPFTLFESELRKHYPHLLPAGYPTPPHSYLRG